MCRTGKVYRQCEDCGTDITCTYEHLCQDCYAALFDDEVTAVEMIPAPADTTGW